MDEMIAMLERGCNFVLSRTGSEFELSVREDAQGATKTLVVSGYSYTPTSKRLMDAVCEALERRG